MRNPFELAIIGLAIGIGTVNEKVKEKYNVDLMENMGKRKEKEDQWEKEHPGGRILKHLTIGTAKGVFGPLGGGVAKVIINKVTLG